MTSDALPRSFNEALRYSRLQSSPFFSVKTCGGTFELPKSAALSSYSLRMDCRLARSFFLGNKIDVRYGKRARRKFACVARDAMQMGGLQNQPPSKSTWDV